MSITEKCQDRRDKKDELCSLNFIMLDLRSLACNDPSVILHLELAGIELIFFIVVPMVLCFGFVTKRVVIAHECLHCC